MNTSPTFILVVYYFRRPAACPTWMSEKRPPDTLSGSVGAMRDCACDKRSAEREKKKRGSQAVEYVELHFLGLPVNFSSSKITAYSCMIQYVDKKKSV